MCQIETSQTSKDNAQDCDPRLDTGVVTLAQLLDQALEAFPTPLLSKTNSILLAIPLSSKIRQDN